MKLKRLIIQGFKSFKDRTVIHFDDGITGIVGPNGCGKSNIVDALFWIMGEQSAKHLRGSTMKDVIFAGSSKYAPGNWAEATLVLDNIEGKHIHIGHTVASPSEIQLTRKLYRNGESEYRINDVHCRLKDIQEVFMDTGAGAKSYSIIAQGEINKIVQQKPEDRRVMIEEVAGITKFKMRKRESLKKIEQTQSNLARLQDLKIEIEKNLKQLEKQAEKAEKARSLKDRVTKYELVTESHKTFDLLKEIRDHRNYLNEKTLNLQSWKVKKQSLEISLEEERLEREEQTIKLNDLQSEYNQISRQLAAQEERLNHLCKSQTEKEKHLDEKAAELEELEAELAQRKLKHQELSDSREEIIANGQEQIDFSGIEEKLNILKEQISDKEDELSAANKDYESCKREWEQIKQEKFMVGPKLAEYAAALQDMTLEIESLEKQYSGVSTELQAKREELRKFESSIKIIEESEKELSLEFTSLKSKLGKGEFDLREKTKNTLQTESKLSSLEDLNKSLEGLKKGTALYLKENQEKGVQLFGSHIKCAPEFTAAVQRSLSEVIECLVIDEVLENFEAKGFIEGMGQEYLEQGLDILLPAVSPQQSSEETCERLKMNGLSNVIPLSSVVEMSSPSKNLKSFMAGHYLAVSSQIEVWQNISNELNFKSITSTDGKIHLKNTGGGKILSFAPAGDNSSGQVARNNKIEELKNLLSILESEKLILEKEVEDDRSKILNLEKTIETNRLELREQREKFIAIKSFVETKTEAFSTSNSRLQILINRKQETSKSRLDLIIRDEELTKKEEALNKSQSAKLSAVDDQKELLLLLKSQFEDERGEFLRLSAEVKTYQERLKSAESQIKDLELQLDKISQRILNNKNAVTRYEEELSSLAEETQNLEKNNLDVAQTLQDREEILSLMKDRLAELLTAMQERENDVRDLGQKINKTEKEMIEHEVKIGQCLTEEEQVTRNIFEKYRIDLRVSVGQSLEYSPEEMSSLQDLSSMYMMEGAHGPEPIMAHTYEFHRRYGQDLKDCHMKLRESKNELSRMGEINWQAIEDYERQKLRFDFLATQEDELKISLNDLQVAIEKIDLKSKERFKVAFDEVNMRFEKVFPIMFGGGVAKLALTGNPDDPECGVDIIAQPPGKKMQNINLMSGGEKALTAVSLIFSIFLVKPSPFCLLDEVDAPLDDANVGRFNELLREMSKDSQFILITHNKKTMELNDTLYGVTMQEPGISKAVSVQLH